MGLNDEQEKIRQAWEWLENAPYESEPYEASFEHLRLNLTDYQDQIRLLAVDTRRYAEALVDGTLED
jgi:hypothetical protein